MNELNNNESKENAEDIFDTPNITDTPDIQDTPHEHHAEEIKSPAAAAVRKGYHNPTARLLNAVFVVLLAFMVIFLVLQLYLNIASYMQQGASVGIAMLYTLAGVSTPFMLCALPFIFKFFAEVVELMDKNR